MGKTREYVKAVYCHLAHLTICRVRQRNAGLDEAQAEIKIARRNINNLRYAADTTHMAESKEAFHQEPLDEGARGE